MDITIGQIAYTTTADEDAALASLLDEATQGTPGEPAAPEAADAHLFRILQHHLDYARQRDAAKLRNLIATVTAEDAAMIDAVLEKYRPGARGVRMGGAGAAEGDARD